MVRMTKIWFSALLFLTGCSECRTPQYLARLHSGLDVPGEATVLNFRDRWGSFIADGETYIEVEIPPDRVEPLIAQARELGYEEYGDVLTIRRVDPADSRNHTTIKLNAQERMLSVHYVIM